MAFIQVLSIVGFVILMTANLTTQLGVTYFAVFLTTIGVSITFVLSLLYVRPNK